MHTTCLNKNKRPRSNSGHSTRVCIVIGGGRTARQLAQRAPKINSLGRSDPGTLRLNICSVDNVAYVQYIYTEERDLSLIGSERPPGSNNLNFRRRSIPVIDKSQEYPCAMRYSAEGGNISTPTGASIQYLRPAY